MNAAVLALFMEPAPYRIGLIRELRRAWKGSLDPLFIGTNLTQRWEDDPSDVGAAVLPAGVVSALTEVRRRLGSRAYRVLHVSGWGHPVTFGSMVLARAYGIPIVSETDTPAPFSEAVWRRWAKSVLYPLLFSLPKMFLPAGQRQSAYLSKYGVTGDRIRQGKLTADVDGIIKFCSAFTSEDRLAFNTRFNIPNSTGTTFLYLGRLEATKGIQDLLSAYIRLRTERSDVRLLIAGGGSLEPLVRDAASSVRSVHFLGRLKGRGVWEAYCASDVFVFPTRRDSWGLVVNEAMAASLPAIVSDGAGCIDDLVVSEETGLVYPRGSSNDLYASMSRLAAAPDRCRNMGRKAQQHISHWTLADEAQIMASTWGTLVGGSGECV
jgi:glycosyltransferase involved in cell wall biosynthesis